MYHAKEAGKNNFQYYSASLDAAVRERLVIEARLRLALQRGDLSLHYQPQVDARTQRILGLEALLRWHDEELGSVPPNRFIPVAEESGLILAIGEWILETACRQCKAWQEAGLSKVTVSINISGVQFTRQDLPEIIQRVLRETGLQADCVEIEVTETTVMSVGEDMVDRLDRIKRLGLKIALDDFGTGYSSLSYLSRFPIDRLKIDRVFVKELGNGPDRDAIVSAILALAKSLHLHTTAEGVETLDQLRYLELAECDMIQGYLFSKPLPAPEIAKLLANPMSLAQIQPD
jgi:EAL domain-containing protein (putative c-di-GMP-specific phosphodiesterase class I)